MTANTELTHLQGTPLRQFSTLDRHFFKEITRRENETNGILEEVPEYFASADLMNAIDYAKITKRPLLLRGEPGSGKTRLAQAIAYELYKDDYRKKYFEWFIKSTSKVNEGLYQFDHLSRLRDVQAGKTKDLFEYRDFGPLGKAFLTSEKDKPSVLLIDEIDKADLDFPNDLLLELDQKRFSIMETGEEIVAKEPPLVFITSNDEKDLPNAFLRRCVFFYIDFPDDSQLLRIITSKAKRQEQEFNKSLPDQLLKDIVVRFRNLYEEMRRNPNTDKVVSTSEMLDWLRVIHFYYLTDKWLGEMNQLPEKLIYPEVLLKSLDDFKAQTNKL
jgi:MoxR-like ATPase